MDKLIQLNSNDNVVIALSPVAMGESLAIDGKVLTAREAIAMGHKLALTALSPGESVIKYGFPIGRATQTIQPGDWVHSHNMATNLDGLASYTYKPRQIYQPEVRPSGTFLGYLRPGSRAGVRNEVWIIPTVGCVNAIAQHLAVDAGARLKKNVDGVYAFPHPYGCSQLGDDHFNTQKALAGLVRHPNAGGVLVLGLGCENNHIAAFKAVLGDYDPQRVKFLSVQSVGDELAEGLAALDELIDYASGFTRQPCQVSELTIGLKCGGSDGLSGITANPLVGRFADLLIAKGGSAILTEVPEMFGAETLLMDRAVNREVFDKTVRLINDFKDYFQSCGQPVYENPSPGNKEGGITTLEDKSLGCVQKGGGSTVTDVLDYGEALSVSGLNLLRAPGNDLVASTALAVSGAQLILFTTGRGTPFGAPVPTIKISSNTELFKQKPNWIDFDAGPIARGADLDALAERFYDFVIETASGKEIRAERNGARDIAIFKTGVTL